MAHQTTNIPWNTLSTSLTCHKHGPRGTPDRITALSLTHTDAATKQRRYFIRAFVRNLAAFATSERAKYPADPLAAMPPPPPIRSNGPPPPPQASDAAHNRAYHTAAAAAAAADDDDDDPANPRIFTPSTEATLESHLASPHSYKRLEDLLSPSRAERRAAGWTEHHRYADPRAELVMALIATNDMLPLLRLARWRVPGSQQQQRSPLMELWKYPGANPGWSNVLHSALDAYLFFNVIYVREELWAGRAEGRDYRDDDTFARVLGACTRWQDGCTWGIPHRVFYGGMFSGYVRTGDEREEMKMRYDPMRTDRLNELREYLKMCWEHLVRVYMVLEEAGKNYDWEDEVEWTTRGLWNMSKP